MVRLTLKQCVYVVAVADHGGIAQAARALNISQPAVAQALDKMEQTYGLTLFVRHHAKGAEATPQGRALLRSARALLQQAAQTERDARAVAALLAGSIRFGCFHTLAPVFLADIIRGYGQSRPQVNIEAQELLQDEILERIDRGDLDLALSYDMALDTDVQSEEVVRLRPFVLLSSEHRLAGAKSVRLAELAEEPFVLFDGPSSREYFASILSSCGISPPVAFCARSLESVRSAVASGLGFSLNVMPLAIANTYNGGSVVSLPVEDYTETIAVVLIKKASAAPSALIDHFSGFCKTVLRDYAV